ncbi:MAG: phosphoribosylglycinamide formyltransferase [Gemmatimonadaceae bacterium]|nr:phosphoribosylglycinamide formyltransferase [Gemmatimonadaceae bacterium]
MTEPASPPRRIAVLASGGGSNLAALLSYFNAAESPVARVCVVMSDRPDAGALGRASAAGVPAEVIGDPGDARSLDEALRRHDVDIVVLAGYLRLVPAAVAAHYAGRIVNVHPALLPRHGGRGMHGARVHRAVLAAGDTASGATVHFVDAEYDRGAAIVRARVPVLAGDTAEALAGRVLVGEHFVLPRAVHALAAGLVRLHADGAATVDLSAAALFDHPPAGVQVELAPAPAHRD